MDFAGMNYLAIVIAAVVSFLFGGVWYNVLATQWMAAIGKTRAQLPDEKPAMLIAAGAQFVMAFVLAGLIGHLGQGQVTLANGVISAAFVWAGFILTTLATNHAFQGATRMLTLIDAGHWLGVLLIQGAIIGWMGV